MVPLLAWCQRLFPMQKLLYLSSKPECLTSPIKLSKKNGRHQCKVGTIHSWWRRETSSDEEILNNEEPPKRMTVEERRKSGMRGHDTREVVLLGRRSHWWGSKVYCSSFSLWKRRSHHPFFHLWSISPPPTVHSEHIQGVFGITRVIRVTLCSGKKTF